jgi:RHS repeat-associated protein
MASGLSITDFCTPPSYCPATSLTRERLAYFIVRAFNLPMASLASPSFVWKGGGISHEVAYLIPKTKSLASVPDFGLPQTDKVIAAPRQSLQGMTITASFVYDGDGNRVAQTVNGVTTYFVGNYYEVTGSTVTKYYYAGGQRVAMRTDTIPQNSTLSYLLADHLNSTSLTLDASGNVLSELRYTAWGEVRYASGNTPTDYTYTGQYANVDDFGLMFYNARWYDPYINHFTQPDTIVPDPNNSQAWDRYAYVSNNPLRYTDPSGHRPDNGCSTTGCHRNEKQISDEQKALEQLQKRGDRSRCRDGNSAYCSGWDNWAWKNIPSSFGIQSGINFQLGVGLEGSYSFETATTFNWRSGQLASTSTVEKGGYFGAPHGTAISGYGGIHTIRGMSDLVSLSGPDAFIEGSLSADAVGEVGVSLQRSQSLIESGGLQFIDPVSQMPQDTGELNLTLGVNAIPNAIDGGINIGESNSEITVQIFDLYDWFE